METILVLLPAEPTGALTSVERETVAAGQSLAQTLGAEFIVGLIGAEVQPTANALAGVNPMTFLGVEGAPFSVARYATDASAAEALCRQSKATLVLAPATSRWNRALPGAAHRLSGRIDAHVTGIQAKIGEGGVSIQRWFYRQRMEAELSRTQRPWMLLVEPGTAAPFEAAPGNAAVQRLTVAADAAQSRTQVTGFREPPLHQQTIRPDAELLFVAGAGWTKKQPDGQVHPSEAEQLILKFLQTTRASLGSSKSLVDLSGEGQTVLPFLNHLNQIGQTGSTPRHRKGLSTCCHGEEPHTVGWRFVHERRAIDLNPNCGWARGKADVLYVADAFQVMAKLNTLLGAS